MMSSIFRIWVVAQTIFLISCSTPPSVSVLDQPLAKTPELQAMLNPGTLTPKTREQLKNLQLEGAYQTNPALAIASLQERLVANSSHANRLTLIELYSDTGGTIAEQNSSAAVGYHLAAADLAFSGTIGPNEDAALREKYLAAYNHACGQVARILFKSGQDWDKTITVQGPGKAYRLKSRHRGEGLVNPGYYDTLEPVEYLDFKAIELKRIRRDGWGAAMVGHRKYSEERHKTERFIPKVGMGLAINATLDFSRSGGEVELAFHDLMLKDETTLRRRSVPLAADLTAPLAMLFNFVTEKNIGLNGLRYPERYIEKHGFVPIGALPPRSDPGGFCPWSHVQSSDLGPGFESIAARPGHAKALPALCVSLSHGISHLLQRYGAEASLEGISGALRSGTQKSSNAQDGSHWS